MKNKEINFMLKNKAKKGLVLAFTITSLTGVFTGCSLNFNKPDTQAVTETLTNLGENYVESEIESKVDEAANELAGKLEDVEITADNAEDAVTVVKEEAAKVEESTSYQFEEATLVRVVDGDTIVVDINGEDYKVRLIGINTPESVAPDSYRVENTEEGVLASDYVKELLKNTKTVYLEKDTSDTDRYGRLLRYVWLEIPEDKENINEIASKMLNGLLVMDNVAEVATYKPDTHYQDAFEYIDESF